MKHMLIWGFANLGGVILFFELSCHFVLFVISGDLTGVFAAYETIWCSLASSSSAPFAFALEVLASSAVTVVWSKLWCCGVCWLSNLVSASSKLGWFISFAGFYGMEGFNVPLRLRFRWFGSFGSLPQWGVGGFSPSIVCIGFGILVHDFKQLCFIFVWWSGEERCALASG